MFLYSNLEKAKLQLESECFEMIRELNAHCSAGWISRKEARGLIGMQLAERVSLTLSGSFEEIEEVVRGMKSARTNMEKKRVARENGQSDLADRYNQDFVRNRILPDVMRRLAGGEAGESILDDLRTMNLSPMTMELVESMVSDYS